MNFWEKHLLDLTKTERGFRINGKGRLAITDAAINLKLSEKLEKD